jgi:hypothetical protein
MNREPIMVAEFFGAALFKSWDVVFGGTYFNYEYAFVYLERKLERNCRGFIPQFQANILSFLGCGWSIPQNSSTIRKIRL